MADDTSLENKFAELSKQIQDQAKFSRFTTVICTAAIAGIIFWVVVQIFSILPDLIVARYMNNLPLIQQEWKFFETNHARPSAKATTNDTK